MKKTIYNLLLFFCFATASAGETITDEIRAQGGTGFKINNIRIFEADEDTVYKEDGVVVPDTRAQGGTGFKIRYKAFDVDPNVTQGTLEEINLINVYKGPVVSTNPLKVFNVDSLTTGRTFFTDGLTTDDIELGDEVMVSGFVDSFSNVLMTRVEKVDQLSEWKLTGYVDSFTGNQFSINNQLIIYSAPAFEDCNGPLVNGSLVEVMASTVPGFGLGDPVNSVTVIRCIDDAVVPQAADDTVISDGFIDALLSGGDFILAGQDVHVTQTTKYIRGRADDIQTGVKVEVEGLADLVTGDITADKIRFIEPRMNLTLPVEPADLVGNQFNVAGVTLTTTPQTTDPDDILGMGISQTTQIRFRGYDYGSGELYITRLNQSGNVDFDDVSLTGFVTQIGSSIIEIFGVSVDTTGTQFVGLNGQVITAVDFFNTVVLGAEVELEEATLNAVTNEISGGTLTLIELPESVLAASKLPASDVIGIGTVTNLPDILFNSSFENKQ